MHMREPSLRWDTELQTPEETFVKVWLIDALRSGYEPSQTPPDAGETSAQSSGLLHTGRGTEDLEEG